MNTRTLTAAIMLASAIWVAPAAGADPTPASPNPQPWTPTYTVPPYPCPDICQWGQTSGCQCGGAW